MVTCGGAFDHERRSYRDNLVVDAHLTGFSRAAARPPFYQTLPGRQSQAIGASRSSLGDDGVGSTRM